MSIILPSCILLALSCGQPALSSTSVVKNAVEDAVHRLESADPEVRQAAAKRRAALGPKAKLAAGELIQVLGDPNCDVADAAADALAAIGSSAAPDLARLLANKAPRLRWFAANILRQMGHGAKPAWTALTKATSDSEPEIRIQAVWALSNIGDPRSIPTLIEVQGRDGEPEDVVRAALHALERFDHGGKRLPALLALLRTDSGGDWAMGALANIGKPALETLVEVANGKVEDKGVRIRAIMAIGWIGKNAGPALPTLVGFLKSPDPELAQTAARALGRIGKTAHSTAPALLDYIKRLSPSGRVGALFDLYAVDPNSQALVSLAADSLVKARDPESRYGAAKILAAIDPKGRAHAVPALIQALRDPDQGVRRWAAKALGKVGPPAREAIPALRAAAASGNRDVQESATTALKAIEKAENK